MKPTLLLIALLSCAQAHDHYKPPIVTPEPASWVLMALGVGVGGAWLKYKNKG